MKRRNRVRRRSMRRKNGRGGGGCLLCLMAAIILGIAVQLQTGVFDRFIIRLHQIEEYLTPQTESTILSLPEMTVYALQLGVYDNGERAGQEAKHLAEEGIPCVIWQREQMRLICAVGFSPEELETALAKGRETYVYQDIFPAVHARLTAGRGETADIKALFTLPDTVLHALLTDEESSAESLCAQVRDAVRRQKNTHPEQPVHAQLIQSLLDWCDLYEENQNRGYAAAAMSTLCCELRRTMNGLE